MSASDSLHEPTAVSLDYKHYVSVYHIGLSRIRKYFNSCFWRPRTRTGISVYHSTDDTTPNSPSLLTQYTTSEDGVTHERVPPQGSHTGQQQQEQQQLAAVRCDEHDMGEQNPLEEAGGAREAAVGVAVNQRQHHEVDESVDPLPSMGNAATELEDVPPSELSPPYPQCEDIEEGFDAQTPTVTASTARSRESASSGIAQERRQQIDLSVSTTRGEGEGGGSRRQHCMEPSPAAMETPSGLPGDARSSDEKHAEQCGDAPALNGDSGSDVINAVSCVSRLKGGLQGSGAADSTGFFPREPGLSPDLQQPCTADLDCNDPSDRDSRREETPAGSFAPPLGEAVSDLNSSSSSERRRRQDISPSEGEREEEEERIVVARLPHHTEEKNVARGTGSDGGNETGRTRDAGDSNREEGLATAGNGRKGGSGNDDHNDIGSADGASFVKDDNLSGSEDEFGRGVAKHIGNNQQQKRREQRHRPSQSPNVEKSGGRSGSTGSSGGSGSGKGTDDTPPSESSRAIDSYHTRVCTYFREAPLAIDTQS